MTTVKQHIAAYEDWLREQCEVVEDDLDKKHQRMRRSAFDFLRASFFRWAATIEGICPSLLDAPRTRCVGDIHVENFGTWRDGQARLVWGINDFDEAASMPYVLDLVRLATSARLAPGLRIDSVDAEQALLEGYWQGLEQPRPLLLDEHEPWLKPLVSGGRNAAREFWMGIDECTQTTPPVPVRKALIRALPKEARVLGFAKQSKGSGSLGRPRFIITAEWQGGRIVREAKAIVPSAWHWAHSRKARPSRLLDLEFGEFRAADPSLTICAGFVLRRAAPDAHKVELDDVTGRQLGAELLAAMGRDLAAVHAAHKRRGRTILDDLSSREPGWLHAATDAAQSALQRDFDVLRRAGVDGA